MVITPLACAHPTAVIFIGSCIEFTICTERVPFEYKKKLLQERPEGRVHDGVTKALGLKTPLATSVAKTMAMMSSAQPYVMRYSIADCALSM